MELDRAVNPSVIEDRLYLLETILRANAHEINNHSQTIILTGQILLEVWEGLKRITDRYFDEHGEFSAGGLEYSMLRDELSGYFSNILDGAQKIEQIVSAIRGFLRKDLEEENGPVDLNHLIESSLILLENSIRKSTSNLQLKLDLLIPKIQGCPQSIKQAILHLIINACRSIHDKKQELELSTHYDASEQNVICEIRVDEAEIPQEVLVRIRGFLSGVGSCPADAFPGLAAIHDIMAIHGGTIDIQSEIEQGTRVTLIFPVGSKGDQLGKP
jgi:signal transduction histidine kinase